MILPADKGRASVVLNTDTYHDKTKHSLKQVHINSLIKTQRTDLAENLLKSFLG